LMVLGVGVSEIVSPNRLLGVVQNATHDRYVYGLNFPIYYNISNGLLLCYSMALAAHLAQGFRITPMAFVPPGIYVLSNLLITTRSPILMMIMLLVFAGAYADRCRRPGLRFRPMFSRRYVLLFLFVGG